MNRLCKLGIAGLVVLMITSTSAFGGFQIVRFALLGSGSLMDPLPTFSGDIIQGDVAPGTFWIKLHMASLWPMDDPLTTEVNERWDYIFSTYFEYDNTAGSEGWDAYIPPLGSGEPLAEWRFYTNAGDTLGGLLSSFTITIRDYDADEVLDENERANKDIAFNFVCYINFSGGCYDELCGQGSASGELDIPDLESAPWEEELYIPSVTSASGMLFLNDTGCTTGTESKTWGGIKAYYND